MFKQHLEKCKNWAHPCIEKCQWLPGLVTRLSVGWVFMEAGWGKINNMASTVEFFTQLGIPAASIQAPFVAGVEFIGGIMLMLGVCARFVSVPLLITMVVAILTAKRADIEGLSDLFAMSDFLFIVLFLWIIVYGAGKISLDHVLCKKH